jgi:toxin ParE1/3/4
VKPLLISEPASQELAEAVRWHEERRPGWGERFFDEVIRTLGLVEAYPESGSPRRGPRPARQLKVRGFPYVVAYRIRADDVYVVAVAHTSRRPGYWQHRP